MSPAGLILASPLELNNKELNRPPIRSNLDGEPRRGPRSIGIIAENGKLCVRP